MITCFASSGFSCVSEPKNIFGSHPTGEHPDIRLRNPQLKIKGSNLSVGRDLLLDISVVTATNKSSLDQKSDEVHLKAAQIRHQAKNSKFRVLSNDHSFDFLPVVFEAHGSWHPTFESLFSTIIKKDSEARMIPMSSLYTYWASRISSVLQKGFAHQLFDKSRVNLIERTSRTLPLGAERRAAMDPPSFTCRLY